MLVKILGSGLTDSMIGKRLPERMHSSILLNRKILVDATPSIVKQLSSEDKIEAVLIGSGLDGSIEGLKKVRKYSVLDKLPVYANGTAIEWMRKKLGDIEGLEYIQVQPGEAFHLLGIHAVPIPVEHSVLQPKFDPSLAWSIGNIVYAPYIDYKFFFSEKAEVLKQHMFVADLTILNGATIKGKARGHLNLFQATDFLNTKGFRNVIFTQLSFGKKEAKKIQNQLKNMNVTYDLAFDGMSLQVMHDEQLIQNFDGFHLAENQAKMIWQGNKTLIVKEQKFKNVKNKLFYFIGGNLAFGVIRIVDTKQIDLKDFEGLKDRHRVSDTERKLWWPGKQKFFAYEFKVVANFEEPRLVEVPGDDPSFIKDVKFLSDLVEREKHLIRNFNYYNPSKTDLPLLKNDFRILLSWCVNKENKRNVDFPLEGMKKKLQLVMGELINRGHIQFNPKKMSDDERVIFEKLMERVEIKEKHNSSLFKYFDDTVILKDAIAISSESLKSDSAINLIVNLKDPSESIRRAVEVRLSKMFPDEMIDKLNFSWGGNKEKKTIPIYDMVLKKHDVHEIIEVADSGITLFKPFELMRPKRVFSDKTDLLQHLYG